MNSIEHPYLKLKEDIVAAVQDGTFRPHSKLPSQRELGVQYGLSHMTVRRAINELTQQGVIYTRAGTGIFVAEPKQNAELGPLISFTDDMRMRGMTASSRILDKRIISASAILANALALSPGQPIFFLRRLRLADGEPMAVQSTFLPSTLFPGMMEADLENGSLYDVLRGAYGMRLADGESTASAELAAPEDAALLKVEMPAALLAVEQITYLQTGQPVEFVRSLYRGDRYHMQPASRRHPK